MPDMADTLREKKDRLRREVEERTRTGEETGFVAVNTLPTGETTSTPPTGTPRKADWEKIQHPGMDPCDEDPYGTRPLSELAKPSEIKDKADLAAIRMMEREMAGREQMDRERIMSTATLEAARARAALASTERASSHPPTDDRLRTGEQPATGEGVPLTTTEPVTRTSPVMTTTTPPLGARTVDERTRKHAGDQSVHPDWQTQPQINAPRDVGIPTAGGQAYAARVRAARRRSDEVSVPPARGASDRDVVGSVKEGARDAEVKARKTTRTVREEIDRSI